MRRRAASAAPRAQPDEHEGRRDEDRAGAEGFLSLRAPAAGVGQAGRRRRGPQDGVGRAIRRPRPADHPPLSWPLSPSVGIPWQFRRKRAAI